MTELMGIVRFTFADGDIVPFKEVSARCRELVRANEPDTLQYDVFLDADESHAVVIERYRDSAALIHHAENLGPLMQEAADIGTCEGELLGELSPELAERMAGAPVGLFRLYQSLDDDPGA